MILTTDFASLTDDLQSIFSEVAKNKIADLKGFKLFNIFDTNRKTYDHLILHGVEGIRKVAEGADLPRVDAQEGDTASWTQAYYGAIVPITKAMRKFDLHNQIESVVKSISADAFDKIDQSLADVLTQGWNTSYTDVYGETVSALCPDGIRLINASHTTPLSSTVFTNIINDGTNDNPALSRAAIVHQRAVGLVHKMYTNGHWQLKPINYDTLIVTPHNEDLAERICLSEYLPGSANNDRNPLKGKIKKIIVWERLQTTASGTDCSDYWFMADSRNLDETLKGIFAERPSLDAPEQVYANKNWDYSIDFFYAIGRGFPLYIAGSDGTNA